MLLLNLSIKRGIKIELNNIFQDMRNNGDPMQAIKMSAYMRNQFLFLGIPTPKRKEFFKKYFK